MQPRYLSFLPALLLIGCGGGGEEPLALTKKSDPASAPKAATNSTEASATKTPAAPAASAAGSGTWDGSQGVAEVKGTIMFSGVAPERAQIDMGADAACHGEGALDPSTIVNNGKLQNVFVYVSEVPAGLTYPKGTGSVMLTQNGCMYEPHVLGLQKGQTLSIANGDQVTHNVHSYSKKNPGFNKSQPAGNPALDVDYKRSEDQFAIKCDIHKWMSSYVCVTDYPFYAVSGADGKFSLGKLPAGAFKLVAQHEVLGEQTAMITVSASGAVTQDFTFKAQ